MKNLKPFNLEEALSGKPVILRNGDEAYIRHLETELRVTAESRVVGYSESGLLLSWCPEGYYNPELRELHQWDIVGMYPETRIINGFEVPVPETEAPSYDTGYYIPLSSGLYFYDELCWSDDVFDEHVLQRGLVFLNKEDAVATAKAMIGIDPKEKKNETI